jgi:hypothetical protein
LLNKARHRLLDVLSGQMLIPSIISNVGGAPLPKPAPADLCLFACIKDDGVFLKEFYRHYSDIGVRHFFIVDDGSEIPVKQFLDHPNVHVFKPETGNFVVAKALWLEALIKYFVEPGRWALVVDADEFLDLPQGQKTIGEVVKAAESKGHDFVPALLVDMLPESKTLEKQAGSLDGSFVKDLAEHCLASGEPAADYANHHSIKWGFGKYAALSWAFDARYHG